MEIFLDFEKPGLQSLYKDLCTNLDTIIHFNGFLGVVVQPIAVYPFNGQFQTRDAIGKAPAGDAHGVVLAQGYNGQASGSYQFSGNENSYIQIPNVNNGLLDLKGSMTLLAKVYAEQRGPLFNYKIDGWGVHFWIVSGPKLFVRITKRQNLGFTNHLVSTLPQQPKWLSVGFSYDSSSGIVSLWIEGKQAATNNIGSFEIATNYAIRIGARKGDNRFFKGRIACIQIYNEALTENQVAAVMNYCDKYNTNAAPQPTTSEESPNPEGESFVENETHVEPSEEVTESENGLGTPEYVERY